MIQYLLVEDEHFAAEEIKRMIQKLRPATEWRDRPTA